MESLGELGIVGFVFIASAFLIGLVAGLRRVLARAGEERLALAAAWAAFLAYAFAAGVDWMWEMTVVSSSASRCSGSWSRARAAE